MSGAQAATPRADQAPGAVSATPAGVRWRGYGLALAAALFLIACWRVHAEPATGLARQLIQIASAGGPLDVLVYAPAAGTADRLPAVVLLHGYLASGEMFERLYAEELARRGFYVAVPLHIAEAALRSARRPAASRLQAETEPVSVLLQHLRRDPRVDPDRIGLLGHSYGATLALEAACADWRVAATVAMAVSLHASEFLTHACPRNLLLLHGGADRFTAERHQNVLIERATRGLVSEPDQPSGDRRRGDARLLHVLPGAGHLTVLFDQAARQAAVDWLQQSLQPGGATAPVRRFPLGWIAAGAAALLLLVESVAVSDARPAPAGGTLPGATLALLAAVASSALLIEPAERVGFSLVQPRLRSELAGAAPYVATLAVVAVLAAPAALLFGAGRLGRPIGHAALRRGFGALGALVLRGALLVVGLRLLLGGYFDPLPDWAHLAAALWLMPLLAAPLLVIAAARRGIDAALAALAGCGALLAARAGCAAALLWLMASPLAIRFNDIAAPAIDLVPFGLALAVTTVLLVGGPRGEPAWSRALYGSALSVLVLARFCPLLP